MIITLLVAVPLKHWAGMPGAVRILGPLHGLAFLAFCWAVINASSEGWLSRSDVARLLAGAFIPLGGVVNERWLKRRPTEAKADAL